MDMLLINLLIVTASVWVIFVVNYKFIQPTLKNKQRFKLYKLRDELSVLAMQGILDERSDEYTALIGVQNSAICASGSFKVTDYLRFLLHFHKDREMKEKLATVLGNLSNMDNFEYCRIARDSFDVMHKIMRRDTRVLRIALFPVLLILVSLLALVKCTIPKEQVDKKKDLIDEIDSDLNDYSSGFGKGCAV